MLDPEVIDAVARGVAQGEYSLLLGAGSSVGATGGNGFVLPTGAGLRDALVRDFALHTDGEQLPLSTVYGTLKRTQGTAVDAYLRAWFTKCRPTWQHLFAEFSWKRIWTLNVDDVMESAYGQAGRFIKSVTWHERFSDREDASAQKIIHLHGTAQQLLPDIDNSEVLVFSLLDYAREIVNPRTWHKVFFDEFAGTPFLTIGAQLTEEIDLASALHQGSASRASTGYPSVLVIPRISQVRREQLIADGFTIVESDGETFIRALLDRFRQIANEYVDAYGANTPKHQRFLQQFIDLRSFAPHSVGQHDFYSGYQPSWSTILGDDDAQLDKTEQAFGQIMDLATGEHTHQTIVFLTGNPGSGKSTGLLRIGRRLIGEGVRPFLFRGDEYMDVDATIEWLRTVPQSVILFDDFAEHSTTLEILAERCKVENVRLLLIGADRPARHSMVADRIDTVFLNVSNSYWYGKLTDEDVDRVLDKLQERGRLSGLTNLDVAERRRHFVVSANRSLFDAMAELETGQGFQETAMKLFDSVPSLELKNLYAAACLCYDQSVPIPTGIGADFAGVAPKDLPALLDKQMRGILMLTRIGIRPPHRITASLVVKTLRDGIKLSTSLDICKALAPHIDERAMSEGTREYRIARHLMNHRTIRNYSDEISGRQWYADLLTHYRWSGRYWDQRALFESSVGQDTTARSYAEMSVNVHPHPFGYNTLGTVLLRMAIKQGSVSILSEGISHLKEAKRRRDWGERAHPYTAFFASLIDYAERWGIDAVSQRVRNEWDSWYREAQSSHIFGTRAGIAQLQNWQRRWLGTVIS